MDLKNSSIPGASASGRSKLSTVNGGVPNGVASKPPSVNGRSASSSSAYLYSDRGLDVPSTPGSPRDLGGIPFPPTAIPSGTQPFQTLTRDSGRMQPAQTPTARDSQDMPRDQAQTARVTSRSNAFASRSAPQAVNAASTVTAPVSHKTRFVVEKISWMRHLICSKPTLCIILATIIATAIAAAVSMSLITITKNHAVVLAILYVILVICVIRFWKEPTRLLFSVFVIIVAAALIPDSGKYVAQFYDNVTFLNNVEKRLRERDSSIYQVFTSIYRFSRDCMPDMTTPQCQQAMFFVHKHGTAVGKAMVDLVSNDINVENMEVKVSFFPNKEEYTLNAAHVSSSVTQLGPNIFTTNTDSAMIISSGVYERSRNTWNNFKQTGENFYSCTYASGVISQIFNVLGVTAGKFYNWVGLGTLDPWAVTLIDVVRTGAMGVEKICQSSMTPPKSNDVMRADACDTQYCKFGTKLDLANITAAFAGGMYMESNTNRSDNAFKYQVRAPPRNDSNSSISRETGGMMCMNHSDGMKIVRFMETTQIALENLPDAAFVLQSINKISNESLLEYSEVHNSLAEGGSEHPGIEAVIFTSQSDHWNELTTCRKGKFLNSSNSRGTTCNPPPLNASKKDPPHEGHSYQDTIKTGVFGFATGLFVHAYAGTILGVVTAATGVVHAGAATANAVAAVANTAAGLANTNNALSLVLMLAGRAR